MPFFSMSFPARDIGLALGYGDMPHRCESSSNGYVRYAHVCSCMVRSSNASRMTPVRLLAQPLITWETADMVGAGCSRLFKLNIKVPVVPGSRFCLGVGTRGRHIPNGLPEHPSAWVGIESHSEILMPRADSHFRPIHCCTTVPALGSTGIGTQVLRTVHRIFKFPRGRHPTVNS